jgi:hypothetical protein
VGRDTGRALRHSRAAVRILVGVLVVYLAVVAVNGPRNSTEIFPFFNWELFSRVPPAERESYSIRLVAVNGQAIEPVYFEKARRYLSTTAIPDAATLLQRIGLSVARGDDARADSQRRLFESRFLAELHSAQYELVRRRYSVLDRLECDCFTEETVVRRYRFG